MMDVNHSKFIKLVKHRMIKVRCKAGCDTEHRLAAGKCGQQMKTWWLLFFVILNDQNSD